VHWVLVSPPPPYLDARSFFCGVLLTPSSAPPPNFTETARPPGSGSFRRLAVFGPEPLWPAPSFLNAKPSDFMCRPSPQPLFVSAFCDPPLANYQDCFGQSCTFTELPPSRSIPAVPLHADSPFSGHCSHKTLVERGPSRNLVPSTRVVCLLGFALFLLPFPQSLTRRSWQLSIDLIVPSDVSSQGFTSRAFSR